MKSEYLEKVYRECLRLSKTIGLKATGPDVGSPFASTQDERRRFALALCLLRRGGRVIVVRRLGIDYIVPKTTILLRDDEVLTGDVWICSGWSSHLLSAHDDREGSQTVKVSHTFDATDIDAIRAHFDDNDTPIAELLEQFVDAAVEMAVEGVHNV